MPSELAREFLDATNWHSGNALEQACQQLATVTDERDRLAEHNGILRASRDAAQRGEAALEAVVEAAQDYTPGALHPYWKAKMELSLPKNQPAEGKT